MKVFSRLLPFWITFVVLFFSGLRFFFPERSLAYTGPRALLDLIFTLGLTNFVIMIAAALGHRLLRWFRLDDLTALEQAIFGIPIGLGVLAYGMLALGLIGWLTPGAVAAWLLVIAALTWNEWSSIIAQIPEQAKTLRDQWRGLGRGPKAIILLAAVILLATLIQSLAPPWDYDGLMYHLESPRQFLAANHMTFNSENWRASGPFTIEMLFSIGLAFGSNTYARLIHLTYAVILIFTTVAFSRRHFSKKTGWIAFAIMLGIPVLPIWASWANTHMGWAAYEFLSLYAVYTWTIERHRNWLVLAGITTGLALGSKFLSAGSAILLGFWILWQNRRDLKKLLVEAFFYAGVAILIALPWYIRSFMLTGNPVYPFIFGGPGWPPARLALLNEYLLNSFGAGSRWIDFLLLPYTVYAKNALFATLSIEMPSILFPLTLLYPWKHTGGERARPLALYAILWLLYWFNGSQQIRFMLPVFPILAILTAIVLQNLFSPRLNRLAVIGLLAGVGIVSLFYQVVTFVQYKPLPVILGLESKAEYLRRNLYDYGAMEYIANSLPGDARVFLIGDGQTYYCNDRCLPLSQESNWLFMLEENQSVEAVIKSLRMQEVTHILFSIGDMGWYIKFHDPNGRYRQATIFFFEQFAPRCGNELFQDDYIILYEFTCQ
jgi:4-amino-4-deoxy-L-arabinose transferase-like glycosyltransferase